MPATNPTDTTKQPALRSRAAAGRSPWRHGAAVSAAAAAAVLAGAALAESLGVTFTDQPAAPSPSPGSRRSP